MEKLEFAKLGADVTLTLAGGEFRPCTITQTYHNVTRLEIVNPDEKREILHLQSDFHYLGNLPMIASFLKREVLRMEAAPSERIAEEFCS
jgi:hypothetical protein